MAQFTKVFFPYDPLPAQDLNDMVGFMNGIATGVNMEPGSVGPDTLAQSAVWWQEIGRTTLSSTSTSISITSLPNRRFLKFFLYIPSLSSSTTVSMRFNNDSSSAYSWNTGDGSNTSQNSIRLVNNTSAQVYMEGSIINTQAHEKMLIANGSRHATGAGGAAIIDVSSGKWANTSSTINRIDVVSISNIAAGGELVVVGHN